MYKSAENIPQLSLENLKLGDKVYKKQLSNIYDTYIILTNVEHTDNGLMGIIGFIGQEITDEVNKLHSPTIPMACVFNDSEELEDDFTYED